MRNGVCFGTYGHFSDSFLSAMEVETVCDNCNNKNLQLLGANKEFFLAKCDHVLYHLFAHITA